MCGWSPVTCQEKRRQRAGASHSGALPATILIGEYQIRAGRITPFVVFICYGGGQQPRCCIPSSFRQHLPVAAASSRRDRYIAEESLRRCDMRGPILPDDRTFCAVIHVLATRHERQDRCSGGMVRALHMWITEAEMRRNATLRTSA